MLRRPAVRALPAGAARHLRGVLPALRACTCLVNDRDWYRARMARLAPDAGHRRRGWGPVRGLLFRPWLLRRRRLLGARAAAPSGRRSTRWRRSACCVWLWSAGARRSFGVRWPVLKSALVDGIPAFVHLVLVGAGRLRRDLDRLADPRPRVRAAPLRHAVHPLRRRQGLADRAPSRTPAGLGEVAQSLRSLWHYHRDVYVFHTHFLNDSTHTYASKPSGWLLLNRPVGVAADVDIQPGTQGCDAPAGSDCLRQVLLLGTPVLWWGGVPGAALRRGDVGRRARLAVRAWPSSARRRPGCPGCSTTTGRSSSSTRSSRCRSWCSRSRWRWAS